MLKTHENCKKCKYYYRRHCVNTTSCLACEMNTRYGVHSICKCVLNSFYEDCPYFVEETNNGKELL